MIIFFFKRNICTFFSGTVLRFEKKISMKSPVQSICIFCHKILLTDAYKIYQKKLLKRIKGRNEIQKYSFCPRQICQSLYGIRIFLEFYFLTKAFLHFFFVLDPQEHSHNPIPFQVNIATTPFYTNAHTYICVYIFTVSIQFFFPIFCLAIGVPDC